MKYLSRKEKHRVRQKFQQFDLDDDGEVNEAEIRGRYTAMYENIEKRQREEASR